MSNKPQRLGKYRIVRELSRNSSAAVFLAQDPYVDRPVALKVPAASIAEVAPEETRNRFFIEAQTTAALRHPNIVQVFDAGIEGDTCYIAMEYIIEGATLKAHCTPDRLLPVERVVELIFRCAKALDYAHAKGVLHRDIKPTNLLLTPEGEVKIGDFGIAYINRGNSTDGLTLSFAGSPGYMSPEQVQEEPISGQTDLFSLGVVMYEMLTGRHPFYAQRFSEVIHKVVNEDAAPMSAYRPDTSPVLERIVARALEKAPANRYKRGLDLASDLAAIFESLWVPARDISLSERFRELRRLAFFSEFSDEELWTIIRGSIRQEFSDDDPILTGGEIESAFYIIVEGSAVVVHAKKKMALLNEGGCFGEIGKITEGARAAAIIANRHCSVLKINETMLEQLSPECQLRFYRLFMKSVLQRLASVTEFALKHLG